MTFTLEKKQNFDAKLYEKAFAITNVSRLRRKRKVSENIRVRFGLDEGTRLIIGYNEFWRQEI